MEREHGDERTMTDAFAADLDDATRFERPAAGIDVVGRLTAHCEVGPVDEALEAPGVVAVSNRVVDRPTGTVAIDDAVSVTSFALANRS